MAVKKVAFEFNPFKNVKVPRNRQAEARELIKDFVKEEVLVSIGSSKSPVSKGRWKRKLSKQYLIRKKKEGGSSVADLELSGDMLDALDVVNKKGGRLSLQVVGPEAGKADGNNRGTYGKKSPGPAKREFIPKKNQTFTKAIWNGIDKIAKRVKEED
jgi:hypothetical protein